MNNLNFNMDGELSTLWFFKLGQNLLGYASVAVPGALLIHFFKRSRFLESNNSCIQRCLHTFVHGNEGNLLPLENDISASSPPQSDASRALLVLFCFFGLQMSYLTWGILQEKIMTRNYDNHYGDVEKFTDSQFLVFVNRVLAFVFAGSYIAFSNQLPHRAPLYKYSYCSFSNIMSSWCQYEALKYVSFPTQVLAKASKIIPVMLMGKVVSRKTYKSHEYVTALVISIGMALFLLSRQPTSNKVNATSASGIVILVAYMVSDSFTSNWQGKLFKQYHMSSVQMMCGVNLFSCILTSVSLLQQGGFYDSFTFFIKFPQFFTDCIMLSVFSAIGQLFIFFTISKFGPVAFVIMMTVRQALAIILSCLIYGHTLTVNAVIGVIIVFSAVFLRIYLNYKDKTRKILLPGPSDQKV